MYCVNMKYITINLSKKRLHFSSLIINSFCQTVQMVITYSLDPILRLFKQAFKFLNRKKPHRAESGWKINSYRNLRSFAIAIADLLS